MKWRIPDSPRQLPLIMGVLNITPDSFSDGGLYFSNVEHALTQVESMVKEGADIIDIGGESTRPGADVVSAEIELERVIPIIEKMKVRFDVPISIDTTKAVVMEAAVGAGASMINDVNALQGDGALSVAKNAQVPVCVMHRQGSAKTMQQDPQYNDVVSEVRQFLLERVEVCATAGISSSQVAVDPGFGFGKTVQHNLELMGALQELAQGQPLLIGVSRKSTIGAVLDKRVDERLFGGLALASIATWQHAAIIRTHDVAETKDVVTMTRAVRDIGCREQITE